MSEQELRAVEEDLQKEAAEDAELKAKYGPRWNRPASVALNSQITEKIAGLFHDLECLHGLDTAQGIEP